MMTTLNIEKSLLIIIDIQDKLLNASFNKNTLEKKSSILAKAANILNIPTIVTEQYPKGLGNTITAIKDALSAETKFFEKLSFSALENEEIANALKTSNKKQIIICGIESHICVNQTVSALLEDGYEVFVIKDACGSRAEVEYNAGLDRMKENGAHIITTEIALFEWLKSSKHPNFKEVQSLIK